MYTCITRQELVRIMMLLLKYLSLYQTNYLPHPHSHSHPHPHPRPRPTLSVHHALYANSSSQQQINTIHLWHITAHFKLSFPTVLPPYNPRKHHGHALYAPRTTSRQHHTQFQQHGHGNVAVAKDYGNVIHLNGDTPTPSYATTTYLIGYNKKGYGYYW